MKNYHAKGEALDWTNGTGADVASGDVVALDGRIAIAAGAIADTAIGVLSLVGVYSLTAKTTDVWSQGDVLHWDKTNKHLTDVATADTVPAGRAYADKANGETAATVILGDDTKKVMANQADSVAADLAALIVDFNALLTKLKAAGYMVED